MGFPFVFGKVINTIIYVFQVSECLSMADKNKNDLGSCNKQIIDVPDPSLVMCFHHFLITSEDQTSWSAWDSLHLVLKSLNPKKTHIVSHCECIHIQPD